MLKETVLSRSLRVMFSGGVALGASLAAHAALAQDAAPAAQAAPIARVEVTGSRLPSPNAESPSPLQVLTSADIAASGATNLQELLLKNPTMGTPSVSRTNSNFSTSSAGVATVDLRNLGTSRTLVLVNGRRYVAGIPGESAVDLNTIPTDFIERVELMTGGASATYGSDAVAGVVNIITKKNFSGLTADVSAGSSEKKDDLKRKLALTWGTTSADGASNVMAHIGFSRQGAVYSRDREGSAIDQMSEMVAKNKKPGNPDDIFKIRRPYYSSYAPQGRFFDDNGSFTYDTSGNVIPWSQNGDATHAATGFNRSAFRSIAIPTDRYVLATTGNLALNENHSMFFEGNYASTKTTSEIEPYALGSEDIYPGSGGQVPAEFMVNGAKVRNPLVPDRLFNNISDTDGDGLRDYYFTRRMAEFGNRKATADRDTFRLVTGLKGTVADWNYEVFGAYGSTKEAQSSTGQVNVLNFRNALEAITDADGKVVCRDANARAQGCVPVNVFGYNTISAAAAKYIAAPGSLDTVTTQKLAGGSINGEPFELPAGKVGIAAGFEWRKEFSSAIPDALTQAGLNAGNAIPPTEGEFSVKEVFVETRVPLLKNKPFAKELSFLGTVRHGQYSTVGGTNSWNAGFEWAPVSDIKLRATRALSTRAPNINELYSPPSQDFPNVTDPCQGVTATSTGKYDAACRAAPGVMANINANGGVFTLSQADIQGVSGYNRGNPKLQAEKGRSSTVGLVITPRSIPMLSKFTFTVDYFDIKIADAIVPTPRAYALEQCYGGGNQAFCSYITRRPAAVGANSAGSLDLVDTSVTNSGGVGTEGVDLTAMWSDRVGPGRLNARLSYTFLKDLYSVPLPGAERDSSTNEVGAAKNKAVMTLGYKWGNFNLSSNTTFIGRSMLDDSFLKAWKIAPGTVGVASRTYNDFQLSYSLRKSTELYAGVDNAFNTKAPPIISGLPGDNTGTETDAGTYDAIGRRYYLGLRVKM